MCIYKRPKYIKYDDGSKWIVGSTIRILPNGQRVNTSLESFQEVASKSPSPSSPTTQQSEQTVQVTKPVQTQPIEAVPALEIESSDEPQQQQQPEEQPELTTTEQMEESTECDVSETDIDNVHGIGPKTAEILRAKNINTVERLFDVIQNDKQLCEELSAEIRGFQRIVDNVTEMCKQ
eukprot:CAMPEP_0197031648 /NCGR_PEP_ID=MMETSP1384-20130603/10592_1 /TAXON_ID=29189 /ORGANISM="Ammonia sp." /LENGTH=177 /DNA_ID=CAMNT_0042461207 /DNA_START=175 /DNA_END=708 /DNA_ORIENTATION=-